MSFEELFVVLDWAQLNALNDVLNIRRLQHKEWETPKYAPASWFSLIMEQANVLADYILEEEFIGTGSKDWNANLYREAVELAATSLALVEFIRRSKDRDKDKKYDNPRNF